MANESTAAEQAAAAVHDAAAGTRSDYVLDGSPEAVAIVRKARGLPPLPTPAGAGDRANRGARGEASPRDVMTSTLARHRQRGQYRADCTCGTFFTTSPASLRHQTDFEAHLADELIRALNAAGDQR